MMRKITFAQSLQEALFEAMRIDERVIVMGEGVDDPVGTWGTTLGLKERFGAGRVMDMPLAENAATGIAVGAALNGLKPVAVHQRIDFLMLAMDQIVNHAAKWRYMFGGLFSLPLTIRCAVGMGWGMGGQHSQNLHALFTHIPGLKVVMPSSAYDAKGLLLSSIFDPDPVIFIENYQLYKSVDDVPRRPYRVPLGKSVLRRRGSDATVVAFSVMVPRVLEAAERLAEQGIDLEVIDARTLVPLDEKSIFSSLKKTRRLIIAEPATLTSGFAAEIIARVGEKMFGVLKAPVLRITFPDCPAPACPALERAYYPDAGEIARTIAKSMRKK
jgi:acetoin:2,6-dichlorophenolindophenol oxidoreductase subunit beta